MTSISRLNSKHPWLSKSFHIACLRHFPDIFLEHGMDGRFNRRQGRFASTAVPTHDQRRLESIQHLYSQLSPLSELSTNPYELERHGRGESYHPTQRPHAILRPAQVEDVSKILEFCNQHLIPVVPFGAGTSVEGHVCCLQGGISLDTSLFQAIETPTDLDPSSTLPDAMARVGAGVTRKTLNQALRHTGMQFVVDPGADATIGGMTATGASGTTTVRYGTMRENILQVDCVLADGTVVQAGTQALKNSAGYDLLSLLCGSEGTLGVITSVTVKLHPIPQHVMAAVCVFPSIKEAAQAVTMLKLSDIPVLRCELLDSTSVAAFNAYKKDLPDRKVLPTLFLEFSASSEAIIQEQVHMTASICDEFEGSDFQCTADEGERKALWAARHMLYYASLNLRPGSKDAIITDACVPISKFAELIDATAKHVEELGVVGPCFGHAGDGNFHCILPIVPGDSEEYILRLHDISNRLIERTLKVGGTCTGEHGIGYGKIKYLHQQYGPGTVAMMKSIKQALDPNNILNPGKVVVV